MEPNDPPLSQTPPDSWIRRNGMNMALAAVALGAIGYYLNPLDVALAAAGLTLIIFLHELGHFAAAKACGVRVETFSIGFGPALPFCSYKYGETTYKLAMVPLGGYVKMLGEGDGSSDDDAETDPRSFRNQSVGERMLIISAGVIMNLALGAILFVAVYMHGLEEQPAVMATLEPGGAAWRQGLHSGTEIRQIGQRQNPWFDDVRPIVWASSKGEQVPMVVEYKGLRTELTIEPLQDEGQAYPVLGIRPPEKLSLFEAKRGDAPPVRVQSAADLASAPFLPGDRIVAMSEPGGKITPVPDILAYYERLAKLAGEPVTFHVVRKGETAETPIVVPAAYRKSIGARMRMGDVSATRKNSPADGLILPGDQLTDVEAGGTLYSNGPVAGRTTLPLDPLKLPHDLNRWADRTPGAKKVRVTVLRDIDHTRKPVTVELAWDDVGRLDQTPTVNANYPQALNGLGFAYHVQAVVDAVVPGSALQAGDTIASIRYKTVNHKGAESFSPWEEIKPHQWAFADFALQRQAPFACEVRVTRGGAPVEVSLAAQDDASCPAEDRGLELAGEYRIQQAHSVGEALQMGVNRTVRSIQSIYMNLYAMFFGRVSFKTMSGPITLARYSYLIAGDSVWRLMLLLALISINLAVVNFLPIPVLDGGHMMFLIYEGLRGKPAPESVQMILTYVGLGMVGVMMLFVIGLDLARLVM